MLAELAAERPHDAVTHYQAAWAHDALGRELDAVRHYERALELGLDGSELEGALLGLGSTYRNVGRHADAERTLRLGRELLGPGSAFDAFLAMTLHNLGRHAGAMDVLLRAFAGGSTNASVQRYRKAILFYADQLDEISP